MSALLRIAALAGAVALSGCARDLDSRAVGAELDEGGFGNATLNNRLAMSGEQGYVTDLNARFAASVPTMITFPFDSAALTPQAQAILRRQADFIRQFPELRFSVYGHTDLVGSAAYNEALGRRRAEAAVGYLANQGVSPSRLRALVSYGETRPLVPVQSPEMRNRRTVTEVSSFVHTHPMVLNGKYAQVVMREYVASAVPQSPNADATETTPSE